MRLHPSILVACLILPLNLSAATSHTINSPDGRIELTVDVSSHVFYSVSLDAKPLLGQCPLSMELGDGTVLGSDPIILAAKPRQHRGAFSPPWGQRSSITDEYDELVLSMEGDYAIVFRAYDDGVAYRFVTRRAGQLIVVNEQIQWNLAGATQVWSTGATGLDSGFEGTFAATAWADVEVETYTYAPVLVELPAGPKLLLTDAALSDYPGLYLQKRDNTNRFQLRGLFPKVPQTTAMGGWKNFIQNVTGTHDYIAKTSGTREFPWRATLIASSDGELLDSELLNKLASPSRIADVSWLQPGKAAWEWWSNWNLEGETFKTGINDATYYRYIDFAAENNIPYLVFDAGWSNYYDMPVINPDLNLRAVIDYAHRQNVEIILWCTWRTLVEQWDIAFDLFSELGIAGIKVDFFNRDDQITIASMEAIAQEAASRQLVVDFHGARALPGFGRTWPNVFNFEGVRGNEYSKFSDEPPQPEHNVILPFTRGLVGPMDYTPGGMTNIFATDYAKSFSQPTTIGTRCHQLAMFVVYSAPLHMMCDSASNYRKAPDFLKFMAEIPSTWEDSKVLDSQIGEHVAIARRSGDTWYVGVLGGEDARTLQLDLSFIRRGVHQATLAIDGVNADRLPIDYQIQSVDLDAQQPFVVNLAPGGGAVLKIELDR